MNPTEALEHHARIARWLRNGAGGPVGELRWQDAYLMRESVFEGQTTFVRAEISEALRVACDGYPNTPLHEDDLPFSNGFAWFERPPWLITPDEGPVQAISWLIGREAGFHGLVFVFWLINPKQSHLLGELARWSFGAGWTEIKVSVDAADDESWRYFRKQARYLASLFAFMKQKILVSYSVLAERHARKRVEREGLLHEPLVRVIELRRREGIEQREDHEAVDVAWSHRWIVRGHWRQQFYPSKHTNQPIWITPYVKGPEDKPLKPPRATVFAVVR
jgi:hypothetical protein